MESNPTAILQNIGELTKEDDQMIRTLNSADYRRARSVIYNILILSLAHEWIMGLMHGTKLMGIVDAKTMRTLKTK